MSRSRAVLLALALGATAGCAATTVDPVDTAPTSDATTATLPAGEPLTALQTEVNQLSERVVDHDGDDESLARIEQYWAAAKPDVEAARPDLVEQFEDAVDYARRAVERRRPADADKAANNLRVLIAHLS